MTKNLKNRTIKFTADEVANGHTKDIYAMRPEYFGRLVRDLADQLDDKRGYRASHAALVLLSAYSYARYIPGFYYTDTVSYDVIDADLLRNGVQPGTYDFVLSRTLDQTTFDRANGIAGDFAGKGFVGLSVLAVKDVVSENKDGSETHKFTSTDYAFNLSQGSQKNILDLTDTEIGAAILYNYQKLLDPRLGYMPNEDYFYHRGKMLVDGEQAFNPELNLKVRNPDLRFMMSGIWHIHFGLQKKAKDLPKDKSLSVPPKAANDLKPI